ncbi:hypothetical protein pb186bvf_003771 [Paramecium bursaria]
MLSDFSYRLGKKLNRSPNNIYFIVCIWRNFDLNKQQIISGQQLQILQFYFGLNINNPVIRESQNKNIPSKVHLIRNNFIQDNYWFKSNKTQFSKNNLTQPYRHHQKYMIKLIIYVMNSDFKFQKLSGT